MPENLYEAYADGHRCRSDELVSEYGRTLPGEIVHTRLETVSTDVVASGGKQLGLQLVGRLAAEPSSDDEDTLGVFVAGVLPGSVAANDGGIHVGDQLLQVHGCTFCVI